MAEKIKPIYRKYKSQIDTLIIGFRRKDKTPAEIKFWQENFPKLKFGDCIAFAISDKNCLAQAKREFPQLDFDTEVI